MISMNSYLRFFSVWSKLGSVSCYWWREKCKSCSSCSICTEEHCHWRGTYFQLQSQIWRGSWGRYWNAGNWKCYFRKGFVKFKYFVNFEFYFKSIFQRKFVCKCSAGKKCQDYPWQPGEKEKWIAEKNQKRIEMRRRREQNKDKKKNADKRKKSVGQSNKRKSDALSRTDIKKSKLWISVTLHIIKTHCQITIFFRQKISTWKFRRYLAKKICISDRARKCLLSIMGTLLIQNGSKQICQRKNSHHLL